MLYKIPTILHVTWKRIFSSSSFQVNYSVIGPQEKMKTKIFWCILNISYFQRYLYAIILIRIETLHAFLF